MLRLKTNDDRLNFINHYLYNRVLLNLEKEEAEEVALEYYDDVKLTESDMKDIYTQDLVFVLYKALREIYHE